MPARSLPKSLLSFSKNLTPNPLQFPISPNPNPTSPQFDLDLETEDLRGERRLLLLLSNEECGSVQAAGVMSLDPWDDTRSRVPAQFMAWVDEFELRV
ncbi:hypothetical protein Droror1_Dr00024786 [Drosera rotundifolia]